MQFEVRSSRLQSEALKLTEAGRRLVNIVGIIDPVRRDLICAEDESLSYAGFRLEEQMAALHQLARKIEALGKGLDKIALLYMGNDLSIEDMTQFNVWRVPGERDDNGSLRMTPIYEGLASDCGYRPELIDTGERVSIGADELSSVIKMKG